MKIEQWGHRRIKPYEKNRGGMTAVRRADSIRERLPTAIVVDAASVIVVGHTRYKAAMKLGLRPCQCMLPPPDAQQARAYDWPTTARPGMPSGTSTCCHRAGRASRRGHGPEAAGLHRQGACRVFRDSIPTLTTATLSKRSASHPLPQVRPRVPLSKCHECPLLSTCNPDTPSPPTRWSYNVRAWPG